ncbi:MAG: FAD-dependent oxidoreductase [Bacteriovoracaceae bacterium]|jgi:glycine cleavage system aminomethyltransferase T/glycine/D-amino acid oxidase-like deaminating enzyme|nr:FAD-dependent oxidoreductase [Bacteriovoracaceae bacterium]
MIDMPKQARVVIVGGGIIGVSTAYHLAHAGWKDVVLIEQNELTAGTTWHAAGLMVTFGSTSETSTELRKYTKDLYKNLEAETGLSTGFSPIGFIEVAPNKDRLEEYRRVSAFNRYCGIDVQEISPAQIKKLFPLAHVDDLEAGFYVPTDGRVDPVGATMSMAKGARIQGAKIIQGVTATGIKKKNGMVTGVKTLQGDIDCEYVVNCAGMWARQFGEMAGVNIPNQAAEHYYLITEECKDLPEGMPILEDPSSYGYYRQEMDGLMIGMFEPVCAPWLANSKIPENFSFQDLSPDWDRMTPFLEKAMARVPITMELGLKKFFCGPESFTPDLAPIIGEAPELKNYFVAAGLNSIGILTGGGIGKLMSEWIMSGRPQYDITGMNIDRLHSYQNTPKYRAARTVESLGNVYKCHYPFKVPQTARDCKKSPFYDRMKAAGAYFTDVSGWESPAWFAPNGKKPEVDELSWGRENWFSYWAEEHNAAREDVIIMDMSFMGKFEVNGRDAGRMLNRISANEVDGDEGMITYTQWLNKDGKLEADLTVTKINEEKFIVVVTDTMHRHVETWMKRNILENEHCFVSDITDGLSQLNIQGPRSRELLQTLTNTDLSNEAFPFRTVKEISVGFAKLYLIRITYVGELGYELYIPSSQSVHVYDEIVAIGERFNLRHAGLRSLGSLRMEKGYRDYGHDIDNTDNPFETGLGFAVNLKTDNDFIGKAAAIKLKPEKLFHQTRRLAQVLVKDPKPLLCHAEIISRNGKAMGYVRAASYGHTLGGAVGLFMIEAGEPVCKKFIEEGEWEIEIAGSNYPALVSLAPMYDPKMEKIKC